MTFTNRSHPTATFIYPIAHRYRAPFHQAMRDRLQDCGVEYRYIFDPNSQRSGRNDVETLEWAVPKKTWTVRLGNKSAIWQNIIPELFRSDVVILQQENRLIGNLIFQLLRPFLKTRVMFFGHGRNFQSSRKSHISEPWKRFWAKRADGWLAYTELTAQHLRKIGVHPELITVFNNTIDTNELSSLKQKIDIENLNAIRAARFNSSQNIGIFIGGMYKEKRLDFLIQAAHKIKHKTPDFHLILLGGGQDEDIVRKAAEKEDWIHFLGPQFGSDKAEALSLAKFMLMPGLVGLTVIEAFHFETPMITTDYPFHSPEICYLEHEKNSIIVDCGDDVEHYANVVSCLMKDDQQRVRLIEGGLKSAKTLTLENMVNNSVDAVLRQLPKPTTSPCFDT